MGTGSSCTSSLLPPASLLPPLLNPPPFGLQGLMPYPELIIMNDAVLLLFDRSNPKDKTCKHKTFALFFPPVGCFAYRVVAKRFVCSSRDEIFKCGIKSKPKSYLRIFDCVCFKNVFGKKFLELLFFFLVCCFNCFVEVADYRIIFLKIRV